MVICSIFRYSWGGFWRFGDWEVGWGGGRGERGFEFNRLTGWNVGRNTFILISLIFLLSSLIILITSFIPNVNHIVIVGGYDGG